MSIIIIIIIIIIVVSHFVYHDFVWKSQSHSHCLLVCNNSRDQKKGRGLAISYPESYGVLVSEATQGKGVGTSCMGTYIIPT